jgi:3-oxoacid CoA-transferase subunit B
MEVSEAGDIANWMIPGKMVKAMGGAMDLVSGAQRIVAVMEHRSKNGESKVKRKCALPITGRRVVNRIITDLAVLDVLPTGLELIEHTPGVTVDDILARTEASIRVSSLLREVNI